MAEKFALTFVTPDHEDFREDGERFWREQDLVVASINTAKSQRYFDVITSIDYDLVVVDEAHYLRNKQTLNHRLVSAIRKRFIFMLSATPVQNNLLELYNLITLLQPGLLSTEAAFKKEYVKRGNLRQPNNPEKLRQLLREVMIRNTRSMVDVKLPKRFATTLYVPPTEGEKETYEDLSACMRLFHETAAAPELFTIRNLQMAAGSSPFALRESIGHLLVRLSGDGASRTNGSVRAMFAAIERKLAAIRTTSKGGQLLFLLRQNQEKKLIFVRYLQTLEYLSALLKDNGYPFAVFSGAMTAREKDAAVEAFRGDVPILISTETGGEGRNIQFCNTLINYDLPWNPMRLEQRIGRIHRIGQERDVFIFNLCLQGSIEDYMMRILDDKINMFELVIGEIDTILGNLETDRDFSSLILDVWLRSGADEERRANFARLGDEIMAAKKTYEQTKALDEVIFGDDYEV
jgi:SNF2 family DNA or RNA helicase